MPLVPAPKAPPGQTETILILAALMSLMAFSVDSMLPALPEIAAELTPADIDRAQLVVGSYLFGAGLGMLLFGPLADSYGRRVSLALGVGLFLAAAFGARHAGTAEALFGFRMLQGVGAAAARTMAQTVTRDLYAGREQARVASLTFMFFVLVPAVAPLIGQAIIAVAGWRSIFTAYLVLGLAVLGWFLARMPETLDPANRRPFRLRPIARASAEVLRTQVSRRYLAVAIVGFGQFIGYLSSAQQLYVDALGAGPLFPALFAVVALISAGSGFLNARLVLRFGMRRLVRAAYASQLVFGAAYLMAWVTGWAPTLPHAPALALFVAWSVTLFFMNGLTIGNVTALAMEPLGHIAGTAAAVLGALSAGLGVLIAAPLGLAYDGTPVPLLTGVVLCSLIGLALVWSDIRARTRTGIAEV